MNRYEAKTIIKVIIISLIAGIICLFVDGMWRNAIDVIRWVISIKLYLDSICRYILGIGKHTAIYSIITIGVICIMEYMLASSGNKIINALQAQLLKLCLPCIMIVRQARIKSTDHVIYDDKKKHLEGTICCHGKYEFAIFDEDCEKHIFPISDIKYVKLYGEKPSGIDCIMRVFNII